MTTNIQLLRSGVAYKRPAAAPLLDGQAAVNYNAAEPGLFFRLTDGSLTKVGPVAMTTDGTRPNSAPAGETGNGVGEQWLNASPVLYRPAQYVFNGSEFVTSSGFTIDEASGNYTLERTIISQRLETGTLLVEGPAAVGGNITPNGQDCAYFLGGPTERWDTGYLCRLDVSGDVTLGTDCTDQLTITAEAVFDCDATFNGDAIFNGNTNISTIGGNPTIGDGCGNSTITMDGETTFNCDTTFVNPLFLSQISGPAITLGNGCGNSTVTANAEVTFNCDVTPATDNTVNLGSPLNRFANIYTGDLHLKNDRGDWTVIEEDEYLSLRNNKTGKTFRLVMEEV